MSGAAPPGGLAVAVHELRSPVVALAALGESLSRGEGERRQAVRLALLACRAIERIVADASSTRLERVPVDVGELLADAAATARLRGWRVRVDPPVELPGVVADPVRLRQALDNLIANAAVHAGDGIILAARRLDGDVALSVADSGPGIAEHDLERIFEPGVSLGSSPAGHGLGLAVVRAVAEAHGGRAIARSTPGRGSTFSIVLPAGDDQPATEAASS